jgi:hypothetical protein
MCAKRLLTELLELHEPAWPLIQGWIQTAENDVEVLPPDEQSRGRALQETDVTTRSPMGAIVYETGGLLVDHGWLRLLGSGHPKLPRSLPTWNRGRATTPDGQPIQFLLIADDVIGGFYALNGGAFGPGAGQIFYFAPDTLSWEPLNGMNYAQFLVWSFGSGLGTFYKSMRWNDWQSAVSSLNGDQAFSIYPPLWSQEGKNIATSSRKPCPIEDIFSLNVLEFRKQLQLRSE